MENLDKYWDNIHLQYTSSYDEWFNKYTSLLNTEGKILELGCGRAYTSIYLLNKGYQNIITTDFSKEVINILNKEQPNLKPMNIGITKRLPFNDNEVNVIIADLSLHYFNKEQTKEIINEIKRVLAPGGYLIGRVNSANDKYHIPTDAQTLEENFYYDGKIYKKFFIQDDFQELFANFKIIFLKEKHVDRYEKPKTLWEFCIKKLD